MLISCNGKEKNNISTDNLKKTSSIISNNNQNLFISEDEDFIYFVDVMTVKKMSKADNSIVDIYTFDGTDYIPVTFLECFKDRIYLVNFENEFISIDKNGNDVMKTVISEEDIEGYSEEATIIPYIFGDNLYFRINNSGLMYRVDPDTHALELADSEIKNQYITSDKTMFMLKAEEEVGRIYVKPENGDKTLFSAENESVILNSVNYTDYYVFYMAFQEKDFSSLYLYRVDLDGENKVLIKKIDLDENNALIEYDNEYIYI